MQQLSFRRIVSITTLAMPLVLAGCANQGITHSGFLSDDAKLRPAAGDARTLAFKRTGIVAQPRRAVVIDTVELRLPPEQATAISPELQARALADFRTALEAAFAQRYTVLAQAPVDGALRVRAAITGLKPSNPALNAITLLVVGPVSNGGVSTESEVVDSVTGERVAAQSTFTNGHLFNGGFGGYFDSLGHVRKAFGVHARKLRDLTAGRVDATAAGDSQPSTTAVAVR